MKKYIIYAFAALLAVSASCVKTDVDGLDGTGRSGVALRFSMEEDWNANAIETDAETRASGMTTTLENTVSNVWIFQFNGTSGSSLLFAPPIYLSGSAINNVPLADGGSAMQRVVAVANTNDANFQWNVMVGSTTYDQLMAKSTSIGSESELYSGSRLVMVGEGSTLTNASSLNIPMKHIVARVEVTVTCTSSSNIVVDAAQLCNIPSRLDLFSGMFSVTAPYPAKASYIYFDYDIYAEASAMPTNNGVAKTLFWYTPQNQQGTVVNSNTKLKNVYAPKEATYVKLYARDVSVTPNTQVVYTFYPGENLTSDYNLKPNGNYRMNVTIYGKNDALVDYRIDDHSVISMAGKAANTYILNPPVSNSSVKYRIFPTQVDVFWGERYENVPTNMLGESTPWTVDVMWMDEQDLVRTTSGNSNVSISKATGTGINDYFELTVPKSVPHGSFLVYIYKTSDGTKTPLWSWHMWVTDYNPDISKLTPIKNKFAYPVTNGYVHRPNGLYWDKDSRYSDSYNRYQGYDIYEKNFLMDRNIGQRNAYPDNASGTVGNNNKGYFYYQFGRKDPFPGPVTLYNMAGGTITYASGTSIPTVTAGNGSGKGIADAVKQPMSYFYANSYDNWIDNSDDNGFGSNEGDYTSKISFYLWSDKNIVWHSNNYGAQQTVVLLSKSLYDPCPYGWKLPTPGKTLYDFNTTSGTAINSNRGLGWTEDGKTGIRYWPMIEVEGSFPVDGRIYIPAAGYREYNGSLSNYTSIATLYANTPGRYTATGSTKYFISNYALRATSSSIYKETGTAQHRAQAFNVRCISDNN